MSEITRRVGGTSAHVGGIKVMTVNPMNGMEARVKVLRIEPGYILVEYLVVQTMEKGRDEFVSLPNGGCKREWMSHDRFSASTREVSALRWP